MSDTTSTSTDSGNISTTEFASSNLSSIQLGGKGFHHKRGCKCKICKKGGQQPSSYLKNVDIIEPLEEMKSVGGLRRRKTKKCKLRKTKTLRRGKKNCSRRSRKH